MQLKQSREALVSELNKAGASRWRGNSCSCAFCDDQHPSAGVYQFEGQWYFKCQACGKHGSVIDVFSSNAGCSPQDAICRSKAPTRPNGDGPARGSIPELEDMLRKQGRIEKCYDYGRMRVYRLMTNNGKTFRPIHKNCTAWVMAAPPKPWPLFNLGAVTAAETLVVVEGEKCVEALATKGIVATTCPSGAGKGKFASWSVLSGKNVALWPDNDPPGFAHMREVVDILRGLEEPPKMWWVNPLCLALDDGGDVADLIQQGVDPREILRKSQAIT